MPLTMVRNDITKMKVDAIVNAANSSLLGGGGVDGAIHHAAGKGLLEECRTLGGCDTGDAKLTRGYDLPAKYVIHTVGPIWRGGNHGEPALLASCYRRSLEIAKEKKLASIAFPMISAGVYGYPKAEALRVARETIADFLKTDDMQVYLVVFDRETTMLLKDKYRELDELIDDRYAETHGDSAQTLEQRRRNRLQFPDLMRREERESVWGEQCFSAEEVRDEAPPAFAKPAGKAKERRARPGKPAKPAKSGKTAKPLFDVLPPAGKMSMDSGIAANAAPEECFGSAASPEAAIRDIRNSIDALLDESFSEMLLRKIDEKGMTDAECYKKANIDRKLFSKIRSDRLYRPSKPTALAFAIALELDIEETRNLLMKAGFALSHASKFDIIVEYFIKRRNYDVFEINEALFAFDQQLLGA